VAPTPADPKADPRFAAVAGTVDRAAKNLKKHPSGAAEAKKARDAAQAPPDDKAGQAKAAQADQMAAAKPKGFDKAGFIAAVKQAIAKAAPQNLDEADKFATSGKADAVKGEVMGKVGQGKEASAQDVAAKTAQPPDPSVAKDKPVTPLPPQPAAQAPPVDGAKAMPGKAPAEQTDLRAGPAEVRSTMADAEVTDQHLTASNEPQMQQAAAAKQQAETHAAQAPAEIRQKEAQVLQQAQAGAAAGTRGAVAAMTAAKTSATGQVGVQQSTAKATEEKERARISGEINKIYDKTKGEVEGILTGLDAKVTQEFERGEAEARRAFTAKHKADMERYKDQRYSGPAGWARWTGDLFMSLPKEADQIFVQAKALYEERMTAVISGVADLIGRELDAAKAKIAAGRQAIKDYVATQPKELQKIATAVAGDVNGKFDQLESDVDAKQESLVEDLAQKYVEARGAVDEEIKAEQAKNQGLVDMAKNAVGESVKSILALKDLFMGLLAKAASAFNLILAKPVQFITNFMSAVKQGFMNFASNILDHLKKGLQGWLFGQLANAGIELPEKFDLMGILKMIASLLGLTWNGIKARIAEKDPFLGKVIDTIQSKIEIFVVLATKGVVGVWDWIKEKVGDLKQLVFDQIKSFIIEKIVKAGITWVLGMLNPAGALIKIVQALISVVQWIMERGAEMGEFIGSIVDAVMDIARGGGGGVPAKIEAALGKAVPLVISFLAGLLGLGGISEKVKSIIEKGQKLVGKAVDWVVGKAMKLARPLVNAMKKGAAWVKGKYEAGKAWVKGKWEAGKAYVKKKWEAAKGWVKGRTKALGGKSDDEKAGDSSAAKEKVARHAADEGYAAVSSVPLSQMTNALAGVLARWRQHGVKSLRMKSVGDDRFAVEAKVNPAVASGKKGAAGMAVVPNSLIMFWNKVKGANKTGRWEISETAAKSETVHALGTFEVDGLKSLRWRASSGASSTKLKKSESRAGAHAEEQIVNRFNSAWQTHGTLVEKDKADAAARGHEQPSSLWADKVRFVIEVSKSTCLSCATQIANFARSVRGRAGQLAAVVDMGARYHPDEMSLPASALEPPGMEKVLSEVLAVNTLGQAPRRAEQAWGQEAGAVEPKIPLSSDPGMSERAFAAATAILWGAGVKVSIKSSQRRATGTDDKELSVKWGRISESTRKHLKRILALIKEHVLSVKAE
jgi:hypothetical protein